MEVQLKYNDWVSHVLRWYYKQDLIECEWLIGPIPTM